MLSVNQELVNHATNGDKSGVLFCIDRGADLHFNNEEALRWAATKGQFEIVEFLVNQGANIEAVPPIFQYTALHCAIIQSHYRIALYLLNLGASITESLNWCTIDGRLDRVKFLIENKLDNIVVNFEKPFKEAIRQGHQDIVKYFTSLDIDVPKIPEFEFMSDKANKTLKFALKEQHKRWNELETRFIH